jgi:hypothetical protein
VSDFFGWLERHSKDFEHIIFIAGNHDLSFEAKAEWIPSLLSELPDNTNIICKMDIEGSEFQVLRHLIKEGTITKLKEIYIEFHERFMPDESKETEKALVEQIRNLGVKVNTWF